MKSLLSILALIFVTGCASVKPKMSSDPKHLWRPIKTVESSLDLQQPLFTTEGVYNLPSLLELGLSKNPKTRAAWWQAKKALARTGRTKSQFLPSISANISANRIQTGTVLNQPSSKVDNWGPGLKISYCLFQFRAGIADAKSAACALEAANYTFNHTLQSVAFEIQSNYYNYASAVATIEACKNSLEDAEASFKAVENRMNNGLARTQDLLLAKADKLQAAYELQSAQANLEHYRAELALSVGVPVSKDFKVDVTFNETNKLTEEVEKLMKKALKARADILAQEASVKATNWSYKKAQSEALPKIEFSGSTNALRYSKDAHWQKNYTLGVGVVWNLFDGFDKQYKELEAYSAMKSQLFDLHQQQLQVLRDVWSEFHTFQSSVQLLDSVKALEAAATESLASIRIGYDAGLNSLLDLLSAQKTLSEARLKRIRSQSNLATHWAKLAYVTGRLENEK